VKDAILDIFAAQRRWRLVSMLGWRELKQRYRRSLFGPFWLTVSTAALVAVISIVFGSALNVPFSEYVPYVAAGMVLWQFITTTITSSCSSFVGSASLIKQSSIPMFVYVEKEIFENVLTLAHNAIIIPLAFLAFGRGIGWTALWAVPGFFLLLLNLSWVCLLLGILSTRYRDLPQTVTSILPSLMFVTPIIWLPSMMPGHFGAAFTDYNPLAHLIELVRGPLLGTAPSAVTWIFSSIAAAIGWLLALALFQRARRRIVFWL